MTKPLMICFALSITGCVCWKVKPQLAYLASFQFKKCQVRCLDIQTLKTLPASKCDADFGGADHLDLPLEECDDVMGFKLETIAKEIKPQAIETRQCLEDKGCK